MREKIAEGYNYREVYTIDDARVSSRLQAAGRPRSTRFPGVEVPLEDSEEESKRRLTHFDLAQIHCHHNIFGVLLSAQRSFNPALPNLSSQQLLVLILFALDRRESAAATEHGLKGYGIHQHPSFDVGIGDGVGDNLLKLWIGIQHAVHQRFPPVVSLAVGIHHDNYGVWKLLPLSR